jgi:hypothetical protein
MVWNFNSDNDRGIMSYTAIEVESLSKIYRLGSEKQSRD